MTKTGDRHLSFKQRHGYDPLPSQMKLEELSDDLRREVWNCINSFLRAYLQAHVTPMNRNYLYKDNGWCFLRRVLGKYSKIPEDEVDTRYPTVNRFFKSAILENSFEDTLELIEFALNDPAFEQNSVNAIHALFEEYAAAYGFDLSQKPYRINPRTSQQESEATMQSMEVLHETGFDAAITHLKEASKHLRLKQYSDSIVDSISAVESVARSIVPDAHTLGQALVPLENQGILKYKELRIALGELYGYTNTEEGLRHALIERAKADVGQAEALFFYNACAAFAGYLARQQEMRGNQ